MDLSCKLSASGRPQANDDLMHKLLEVDRRPSAASDLFTVELLKSV